MVVYPSRPDPSCLSRSMQYLRKAGSLLSGRTVSLCMLRYIELLNGRSQINFTKDGLAGFMGRLGSDLSTTGGLFRSFHDSGSSVLSILEPSKFSEYSN